MTSRDRQREIEGHEHWLRDVCHDDFDFDIERIKTRVRVAVDEKWLARRMHDRPPLDLENRTRRRVRSSLAKLRERAGASRDPAVAKRSVWSVYRWPGGLGLAAAACLLAAVGLSLLDKPGWVAEPQDGGMQSAENAGLAELPLVTAFESFAEDELTQSLLALAGDLDDLEVAWSERFTRQARDAAYADLVDVIDDLLWEAELDDDRS